MRAPCVLLEDSLRGMGVLYARPKALFVARAPGEVAGVFEEMERARAAGLHLAGYAAYELGLALEPRLSPLMPSGRRLPLLRFGAFEAPSPYEPPGAAPAFEGLDLRPDWGLAAYAGPFRRAIDYIFAGDVFQINLTFPMRGRYEGDPFALYRMLARRQPVPHGGVVALAEGEEAVVSLSPERFFAVEGGRIRARPMKGTAARGGDPEADRRVREALAKDPKNRAENLMIVDLLRNDIGRVCEVGSIRVPDLFTVETYRTLHQMTSGVEGRLRRGVGIADLFAGLFPCGSVTGAPKVRAMEVIAELEDAPRGVYCGAIGSIAPNGDARFNVAIRTLTLFPGGEVVANVGSGLVADSDLDDEYAECLLKARFASA
ncbi:MAG: aminodeoxychorismate synthase component I [Geminicoccaceae bacterium]|nr:aminodeoxychorismate synthase component I [Geminicoccaceae bacterium]